MQHEANHSNTTEGEHIHIVSPKIYLTIFLALLFFTGLTVAVSFVDLGIFNPIVALFIAATKMTLVVLFFMHVKYSSKLTKLTVLAGLFMFLALISMTLADYISRAWGRW